MDDRSRQPAPPLEIRDYAVELEPDVVALLRETFGDEWGDGAFWRWKHLTRPGFEPRDVAVFTAEGKTAACFHVSVRTLHLLPGLDVSCSIEGDFAVRPELRGVGLPQQAYLYAAPRLAERSVVLRAGFSSPELYQRVYKRKFGHRMIPTVTTQYRKILSDRALRAKLQGVGDEIRSRPSWQRLLKHRALSIRIDVAGFQPCGLVLTQESSSCMAELPQRTDLCLKMPYTVLVAARTRRLPAALATARAVLSGRMRAAGLLRVLARWSHAQL